MDYSIESLDRKGRGIARDSGKPVAVPFTVPGDTVRVGLRGKRAGVRNGVLEEVLTPSTDRIVPRCPYAGRCGGCPWQMFDADAQLRHKHATVTNALAGIPHPDIPQPIPSPDLFYYRNRMDYAVGADGSLGLHMPGRWWEVLDLSTCYLMSEAAVAAMHAFRSWMHDHHVLPWDTRSHTGVIRALVLREGKRTGERMAMAITAAALPPDTRAALIEALAPHCTSILCGVQPGVADVTTAEHYDVLRGDTHLHEQLHIASADAAPTQRLDFRIPPNAFFQTNTLAAEHLVAVVRDFAALAPPETLVDLFCGVGTFGIALARDAGTVIGVELDPSAAAVAQQNAEANGIQNARFMHVAAESWPFPQEPIHCLIVDPPRAGMHPRTLEHIRTHAPHRIVYVSCNPHALASDLRTLVGTATDGQPGPYRIERIQPLDLFPHTPHVETVVKLVRT
ncbi:MAG: 23S rRNA (uracil(1939)-C(5))-methyltransferase RlmD [bacterium]|nr:23S rRNA (uracil(1939)-C(5))-methyltransferase RlmD [bacterium]